MWQLELKLYGEQQKITGTTKSIRELQYGEYSKIPNKNYPLHRISNRCYHNKQRYSSIK